MHTTDAHKTTSKRVLKKTTDDLIGNKISDKIITAASYKTSGDSATSKMSAQIGEMSMEVPRETYVEKQQQLLMSSDYFNNYYIEREWTIKKIINLLNKTVDKLLKFKTKNCVEINKDVRENHNVNSQIIFEAQY